MFIHTHPAVILLHLYYIHLSVLVYPTSNIFTQSSKHPFQFHLYPSLGLSPLIIYHTHPLPYDHPPPLPAVSLSLALPPLLLTFSSICQSSSYSYPLCVRYIQHYLNLDFNRYYILLDYGPYTIYTFPFPAFSFMYQGYWGLALTRK